MAKKWQIKLSSGGVDGPFSETQIRRKYKAGEISASDELIKAAPETVGDLFENDVTRISSKPRKATVYERSYNRNISKKFLIIDTRHRRLGPLSAKEIESLYLRRIVEKSVVVVKIGSSKRIPIKLFIDTYGSGGRNLNQNFDRHDPRIHWSYPSARVMDELSKRAVQVYQRKPSSEIWYIFLGIAAGIFSMSLISFYQFSRSSDTSYEPVVQEIMEVETDQAVIPKIKKIKKPLKNRVVKKKKPRYKIRPIRKKVQKKPRKITRRYVQPPRVAKKTKVQKSNVYRPQKISRNTNPYLTRNGQIYTISKARYRTKDLLKCKTKCKLKVSDTSGRTVTAVFFKGQHAIKLAKKRGSASLTGRITTNGGSVTIYLQSVR